MFLYKFPIVVVTFMALLQPPIVIAQDFEEVNNIARNISVKITGHVNGSGFILEREGNVYSVVTNKHIVFVDTKYQIQTYDGIKHRVTSRQEIPDLDLAIIQFESTKEYEVAELGNSDELQPRQSISVAGFPGGQTDIDIVDGQIRSIRQEIITNPTSKRGYALIYTNQTLPGSSGGAVLDENGLVVAINGEGETDIKTGRQISRGIPTNIFLKAKENLLAKNNSLTVTTNYASRELKRTLDAHGYWVWSVAVNNNRIVGGSGDKTIKVWDLTTGELDKTLAGHSGEVLTVAVSNNTIISGSDDKTIKVWDLTTGELRYTLSEHDNWVNSVAISNNTLVSGSDDKTIKVWDLTTGELRYTLSEHDDWVTSVAISNNTLVSGSKDKTIKVWNLATGELRYTLSAHNNVINSVAISDNTLVSGSDDKTIKVWDLTTGELRYTLSEHDDWVNSVAIMGNILVSGSKDKTIKIWRLQQ